MITNPPPDTESFDAIIVGSGFGGSVCASRLAAAGLDVVVLERGAPYPPGAFARTPRQMRTNFWDPDAGLHGLFEVWSFAQVKAIVSAGLGGGSLIYANVLLPKPPETFADRLLPDGTLVSWPVGHTDLEPHYQAVLDVLRPERLPTNEPYASIPKTLEFARAARAAGLTVEHPPLAIRFAAGGAPPEPGIPLPPDDNLHGRPRLTCRLLGACDVGCNEGAKSSLDMTYLSEAKRRGARIRTLCEAVAVGRDHGSGWRVRYVQHVCARAGHRPDLLDPTQEVDRTITAPVVVIAAGTLGSTRLLLGHRAALPGLSRQLGRRFSTNGDMITFARDCRTTGERRGPSRDLSPSLGPVITTSARGSVGGHDVWLQDAGGPEFSEWGWQGPELPGDLLGLIRRLLLRRAAEALGGSRRRTRVSADVAAGFGSARSSAAMLPLLSMGIDVPGGRLSLDGDVLNLDWDPHGDSRDYFDAAEAAARTTAEQLGGHLAPRFGLARARAMTVHPLGGCSMGRDRDQGVVDDHGEVFSADGLHRGLFVADGAVMPGPVGPNPSLTIAALADRFSARMIDRAASR
ncbi:MAG: GMC family oxidoreductase N-terminal domain-containing protein [Actinobacteria bacterium]|nr:GMC family oxidoreductase N-terminal domain-containing protein [Actinomycetota bacterium]